MTKVLEEDVKKDVAPNYGEQDLLNQLLNPEVQESLTNLVAMLPKLNELVTVLTKTYDVVQSLATDEVLKNDTVNAVKEMAQPVCDSAKTLAQTVIEAKDRAEESTEVIGIFGLLRMLKDPQVQKLFRFINAFLQVSAEKQGEK